MPSTTDAELVAAHLAGDRAALAAIYDRYSGSLYDTAASMTRSRHDAADVMQDVFVIAAERLGQLRDPSRLKPWLFAVLRNEVYRRTGKKRRTVATDFSEPAAEMTLPTDDHDPAANAERDELAALVRGAAAGLDERDQLILELSVRQGLEGDDLADALGVSPQQCYSMLHRMRQRTERSLAAYCVARQGRKDCAELADILAGWDGEFSVLIRKRVARHVDGCDTCEPKRHALAPFALFGAAPVFAAPSGLRDQVLAAADAVRPAAEAGAGGADASNGAATYGFGAPGGFPSVIKYAQRVALWLVTTAAALMLATGTTVYVLADDGSSEQDPPAVSTTLADAPSGSTTTTEAISATTLPAALPAGSTSTTTTTPATSTSTTSTSTSTTTTSTTTSTTSTTVPPTTSTTVAPGSLSLSAGTIDFGTSTLEARIRLFNQGGQPVDWTSFGGPVGFRGAASPFLYSPSGGTLAPGASTEITIWFDHDWPTEGQRSQRVTFVGDGTSVAVDLRGTVARPPRITIDAAPPATACWFDAAALSATIKATVADESEPTTGLFELVAPKTGTSLSAPTDRQPPEHSATVSTDTNGDGIVDEAGLWSWTLTVTDTHGNSARQVGIMNVQSC